MSNTSEQWLKRAQSIGVGEKMPSKPSKTEMEWTWAQCAQALRLGHAEDCLKILERIDFFPIGEYSLTWLAALQPNADAFLPIVEKLFEYEFKDDDDVREYQMASWLRKNAYTSSYDAMDSYSHSRTRSDLNHPILSSFVADNPMALAHLLSNELWLKALLSLEPKPKQIDYSKYLYSLAEEVAKEGAAAEASLLYEALEYDASHCMALLVSIPEFCKHLITGEVAPARNIRNPHRSAQDVFVEGEFVQWSLWETVLQKEQDAFINHKKSYECVIDALIEHVDPNWVKPQVGTGCLWSDILATRSSFRKEAQCKKFIDRLNKLEEKGHPIVWANIIEVLHRRQTRAYHEEVVQLQLLLEVCELKAATSNNNIKKTPKQKTRAL